MSFLELVLTPPPGMKVSRDQEVQYLLPNEGWWTRDHQFDCRVRETTQHGFFAGGENFQANS